MVFATVLEARQWVEQFVHWYNTEHRHSAIQFVTPNERHQGVDGAPLIEAGDANAVFTA